MDHGRIQKPFLTGFKLALAVPVFSGLVLWLVDDVDPLLVLGLMTVIGIPGVLVCTLLMGVLFKSASTATPRVSRHVTEVVEIEVPSDLPGALPASRPPPKQAMFGYGQP